MCDFNNRLLSIFCDKIQDITTGNALRYLNYDINNDDIFIAKLHNLRSSLYSFYSLYQYCRSKNININNIVTEKEKTTIFNLILTLDKLNIELAKQMLIIKIRECMMKKK